MFLEGYDKQSFFSEGYDNQFCSGMRPCCYGIIHYDQIVTADSFCLFLTVMFHRWLGSIGNHSNSKSLSVNTSETQISSFHIQTANPAFKTECSSVFKALLPLWESH